MAGIAGHPPEETGWAAEAVSLLPDAIDWRRYTFRLSLGPVHASLVWRPSTEIRSALAKVRFRSLAVMGAREMANGQRPGLLSGMSVTTLWRAYSAPENQLTAEEAASTLFRFFRSKHVVDLRLIVLTILTLLSLYVIIIIIVLTVETAGIDTTVKLIGPAVGIAGLIISWAYKAASTRLGIIDLFGCEIVTLCRVGTIFDIGTRYIGTYKGRAGSNDDAPEKRAPGDNYTSQEDYFPIFDNNSSDLQLLEALVVTPITEFYTFMKATRDTQRLLASIPLPRVSDDVTEQAQTPWHAAVLNVVYMIFLGYEAGRNAIDQLVEFEPAAAENTIVILITELTCYGFLLGKLKGDLRYPRLHLRLKTYKTITPRLYREIDSRGENDDYWRPALELLPQLRARYEAALGETMDQALARLGPE
jgi:hypothetical protein